ncbi:MAG TPA: amino acid ABC transporter substrate-binding protein [Chloroflexota bacterium]
MRPTTKAEAMMLARAALVTLVVSTVIVAPSGIVGSTITQARPALAQRTLTFGAPISLTGATSAEGKLALDGYKLWAREVNDRGGFRAGKVIYRVVLKYYDDGSNPTRSAQLTRKLVRSDKVNFLLGPYGTTATLADEVVAEHNHVPMVEGTGASAAIFSRNYRYIFGVISLAPKYGKVMLRAALGMPGPPHTLAIIYASDAFSRDVAAAARVYALRHGMKVVLYREYPAGATTLTQLMTEVKTARPDMLLGSGHATETIAAMKEARGLGIQAKLFAFTVGPTTPGFIKDLGRDADDVISSVQWTAEERFQGIDIFRTPKHYARIFESVYGRPPAYQAAAATAAGLAFQFAIKRAGDINRQHVRNALAGLTIPTFFGPIRFDSRGANSSKSMAVIQIQNGHMVTVYPPGVGNGMMVYPTPPFGHR